MRNRKFIKLNEAINYSKQNGLKILGVNVKFLNKKTNTKEYVYNYICINDNEYYKFIKKQLNHIEVVNDFESIEKIYNNYNFEILTNNKRKLYFDIDKIPKEQIDKIIDILKSKVKELINIVDEPLIFIRENQSSIHIIYDKYSIDYLHHKEL